MSNIQGNTRLVFTILMVGQFVTAESKGKVVFHSFPIVPTVLAVVCFGIVVGVILAILCKTNSDETQTNEQQLPGTAPGIESVPCILVQSDKKKKTKAQS